MTSRTMLAIAGVVLFASGGYVAGARRTPQPMLEHAASAIASLDAPSVRSIVREEIARAGLAARACPSAPASTTATVALTQPAVDPEAQAARDRETQTLVARAHDIINGALANGTWNESDRAVLRSIVVHLPQAEQEAVYSTLFPALSDGRLKPAFAGMPL
jgi:hypothetical protein